MADEAHEISIESDHAVPTYTTRIVCSCGYVGEWRTGYVNPASEPHLAEGTKSPHPRPPLMDPETGFRSRQRRSEVWCEECGAFFHFSNPHPHPKGTNGRRVDWPPQGD